MWPEWSEWRKWEWDGVKIGKKWKNKKEKEKMKNEKWKKMRMKLLLGEVKEKVKEGVISNLNVNFLTSYILN